MSFFNQKEQVIYIELTSYGKNLLSQGRLKPEYYSFFDDDILYDGKYGGPSDSDNTIPQRITGSTPRPMYPGLYMKGADSRNRNQYEVIYYIEEFEPKTILSDKSNRYKKTIISNPGKAYAPLSLGTTSEYFSNTASASEIHFFKGELTGAINYITGAHPTQQIPQLNTKTIDYKFYMIRPENKGQLIDSVMTEVFPDGTREGVLEDYLLIGIEEHNAGFLRENFDIEIFLVSKEDVEGAIATPGLPTADITKMERLTPLYFYKSYDKTPDYPILQDKKTRLSSNPKKLDTSYVEKFLDVRVDEEIENRIICEYVPDDYRRNIYFDDTFECLNTGSIQREIQSYEINYGIANGTIC